MFSFSHHLTICVFIYLLFNSAEEKAREAESKRIALEGRLGEDVSKESRVSHSLHFDSFSKHIRWLCVCKEDLLKHTWNKLFFFCLKTILEACYNILIDLLLLASTPLGNPEKGSRFSHDA